MNKREMQEELQKGLSLMRGIYRACNLTDEQLATAEGVVSRLEAGIVELAHDEKWDETGAHIGPWWWDTPVN
jgi:hypothetical protein